ncbi:hypothetical protein HPP92_007267 [Vanilla planifolia]|uniref:Uncharacterized protein n=1 Tax=Vanilla planifolia TaxID=51239 RepID=A0A835V9X0_VANPL|nr:hypothetical protein HPP92_007267 [Vanilla planifolia]
MKKTMNESFFETYKERRLFYYKNDEPIEKMKKVTDKPGHDFNASKGWTSCMITKKKHCHGRIDKDAVGVMVVLMSSGMTTSPSQAIKCLNTSTYQRRFVFKTFSQRVEEINIDVFHSLETIRIEPKEGSSFLREALVHWRVSSMGAEYCRGLHLFYEEMMPLVQTLPQILLQKKKIFSELLGRLRMGAKLSIEPILMLVVAFSRDILKDFLPFLRRLARSITCLLLAGGDRDPEILEQVFKAWSYIIMYLQKDLEKDVVTLLKITVQLRHYPKDYVQEFVAEAVSFLLRNASLNELKAEPALNIKDVPQEAVLEVLTGILQRLCEEIDPKEQNVVYECLFECIHVRITQGYLAQVDPLLTLLITAIRLSRSGEVFDSIKMSELVRLLVQACIPLADRKSDGCSSESTLQVPQRSIWQDLLGVTLDSYQKLLLRECSRPSDAYFFLNLARRHKSSSCILSAVAEYFDSSLGLNHEAGVSRSIFSEIGVEDPCISINFFADNLSLPNKEIRIATLRILSHRALLDDYPTSEERPNKKVKYEESVSVRASRCINVVDVLLSIERTPISVFTSRKIFILISKLQMALSSGMVNEDYSIGLQPLGTVLVASVPGLANVGPKNGRTVIDGRGPVGWGSKQALRDGQL